MTLPKPHQDIIDYYETSLATHGDSHLGVGWPNPVDVETRYRVMLECIREADQPLEILDFGCGPSHMLDFMRRHALDRLTYAGLDIVAESVALSRAKNPDITYYEMDVLESAAALPMFDYIILNGVFTVKRDMTQEAMLAYFKQVLEIVFSKARRGIAFNVMAKAVDWERSDLFHLPVDELIGFLVKSLSRHFVVRNDYGLYEYTTYVYKDVDHGLRHPLWAGR